jgi:hypothetical protein
MQHPYGTWSFSGSNALQRSAWADQSVTAAYQIANANYTLLYGFDVNPARLTDRQQHLDADLSAGDADTSNEVKLETLHVMGLNWLAQTELANQLLAGQESVISHFHHRLGRMAQETGRGYYIDVYEQVLGLFADNTTNSSGTCEQYQVFQIGSYFESAMEHGIIEQLQNSNLVAASTVKLLELASTNSETIYMATRTNWSSVSGGLSNYNNSFLYNNFIASNYTLLLPANGSINVAGTGSWAGSGFIAFQSQASGAQDSKMIIGGGYNGGYVSDPTAIPNTPVITSIDANQPTYFNPQPATVGMPTGPAGDPVSMVDGSFQITSIDLALGGIEPRGLNLTRYYSSARRYVNLAGMAPGWLHNYYCTATPESGWKATLGGTATPQQMAPILVAIRSALDVTIAARQIQKIGW